MIKNVVFDLGQVLFRFEPMQLVSKYAKSEEDRRTLAAVVFDRLYWDRLDLGTIEDEELLGLACERLPERLREKGRLAYYNWIYNMPEMPGMREVVSRAKKMGARVFVLSNISRYFASHAKEFSLLSEFEYCLFSAEVGVVKPQREIFARLTEAVGILPEETLFIDDSKINIAGAEAFGIKGYLFDGDVDKLRNYLDDVLENVNE